MYCALEVMVLTVALPLGGDDQELGEDDYDFARSLPSVAYSISPVPSILDDPGLHEEAVEHETEQLKSKRTVHEAGISAEVERKKKDRIAQQVFDATLILSRNEKMLPAVQVGVPKLDLVSDLFRLPSLGRLAHIENTMHDETLNRQATTGLSGPLPFTKRRLLTAKLAKSDDELLTSALRKLRSLVLYWPEDSKLGRALLTSAGAVVGEDVLQQSLKDCFAGKAVATLVKRAADFTRFAEWMIQTGRGRPLNPTEADLYGYISMLRANGAGATAGESFLSAWRFMVHTVGAGQAANNDLISGRVLGASKDLVSKKRALHQAPPLTADMVWKLEGLMAAPMSQRFKAILGFLLFCLYSCCRFGDGARAHEPTLSQFQHIILVETACSEYKTATGERRAVLLPLVALGSGLSGSGWALSWMAARRASGLIGKTFLMPADAENSDHWLDRRMTTAEGSYWLKDLLVLAGLKEHEASGFSTHSLKATLLSWAAKSATFDLQERLILGHHLDEETKMAVTYSRDAIAATMVKVYRMLETVRQGIFDPDASRAERIAMATGLSHLATHLPEKNEMELDLEERLCKEMERAGQCETDVEEDGADIQPVKIPEESQSFARSDFPPVESTHCVVHRLSGIVHCMETSDSLLCGRRMSLNMKPIDFPWEDRATHEFCEQCNRALYR